MEPTRFYNNMDYVRGSKSLLCGWSYKIWTSSILMIQS